MPRLFGSERGPLSAADGSKSSNRLGTFDAGDRSEGACNLEWTFLMLGETSYGLLWVWLLGVIALGTVLFYGMRMSGRLGRREKQRLNESTIDLQRREDPQKH
jgi:hypothetical protein